MLEFALANIRRRDYKDYLFVAAKTNQWLENPEKEIEVLLQLQIEEALAREKLLADESQL